MVLPDGYRASVRWWIPPSPRGAVLYLHGIQSHGGWYEKSGQALSDSGLAVLMPDRRGSGRNAETRGHADSADQCLADAAAELHELLERTGCRVAHVVGVSWGGKLAVSLAARHPRQIAGISLVAPGLFPKVDLTASQKLSVAMSLVRGRDRFYDIPITAPRMFTSNPQWLAYLERDQLQLREVTAHFLLASRQLDRIARRFRYSAWSGSLHLLLAGRDQIVDNDRTRSWFDALPWPDRRLTLYPDAEHTIEFEDSAPEFTTDLGDWILARAAGSTSGKKDE